MTNYVEAVQRTANGTAYLQAPGVVLVAGTSEFMPLMDEGDCLEETLSGLDTEFANYVSDWYDDPDGDPVVTAAEWVTKFAGQVCYLSLGPGRTMAKDAQKYFDNIKSQGHGSVLEHASATLFLTGVSRSLTHELVRHRAGFAFSQVSQRYVGPEHLRFVERPEYQAYAPLHERFESRIDAVAFDYKNMVEHLETDPGLAQLARVEKRKAVQQVARSLLPNETEAPIVVTANLRAWRHFIEMRCSSFAEPEIRLLAYRVLQVLKDYAPLIFSDYKERTLSDGSTVVTTQWSKV